MTHNSKSQLISNSGWQILFSIMRAIVGFGSTAFIASRLGPDRFGELQYVFSISYLLQVFELFSHQSIVKKMLLEKKYSHEQIMGTAFVINFITICSVLIITYIMASFLYEDRYLFWIFICAQIGLLARSFNNIAFHFDSILESKKTSFTQFSGNLGSNLSRVIVLFFTENLILQSLLFSIQFIITSTLNIIFYTKKGASAINWKFNNEAKRSILKLSAPLILSAISAIIFLKIDIIMLEHLASTEAVGIYSVAVKLSEPWFFFCSAIIISFFPSVMSVKSVSLKSYYYKLTRLNSIIFLLGMSISIFMSISAYYWITYLFGSEYQDAIKVLQIHIWGITFLFWNNLQHLWEVKENYLTYALIKSVFTSSLNITLNFYLIPEHGTLGAAYATVVSYLMTGFLFNICTKKSRFYMKIQLRSILFYKYLSIKEVKQVLKKS
jgi:O-antigen/teichoic acid export membrane protein